MITADKITEILLEMHDEEQRRQLMRFFKTGPGEYGEGDCFIGLRVPQVRMVVREARGQVSLDEISRLLSCEWHEVRLCGFLLLVEDMKAASGSKRKDADSERMQTIAEFYLRHARRANNWDLVDLSCQYILGPWLYASGDFGLLHRLAESDNLWEQRIAVVTTLHFIRAGLCKPAFEISLKLLCHPHDLIHKAIGWILREAGKREPDNLRDFLSAHLNKMPRTTLRYAIERFPEHERKEWLRR